MKKLFTLGSLLLLSTVVLAGCNTAPQVDETVREDAMMNSNYMNYDEQKVADALADNKDVVLFFHAQRCSSCKKLDANILSSVETIPENLMIVKVDYDNSNELKAMYNVTTQHTLVLLNNDMSEQKKITGGNTLQDIIDFVGVTESVDSTDEGMNEGESDESAGSRDEVSTTTTEVSGTYTAYSEEAVKSALAKGKEALVFFHAGRCSKCNKLDAAITASVDDIPANIALFKADYDAETEMKTTYGVTTQHTIVALNTDMTEKNKVMGSKDLNEVLTVLQ